MPFDLSGDLLDDPAVAARFAARTRLGKWRCIEWNGGRNRGYGVFPIAGTTMPAHCVAWMLHHRRTVPHGHVVDHMCCNKGCVNWDHLEAVTELENVLRIRRPAPGWIPTGSKRFPNRRKRVGTRMSDRAA